jgi:hypothetical protein
MSHIFQDLRKARKTKTRAKETHGYTFAAFYSHSTRTNAWHEKYLAVVVVYEKSERVRRSG